MSAVGDREAISAAILAGGKSSRMGVDKALLALDDGRPFVLRTADRAGAVADDVFVVATARPEYEELGLRVVPDSHPADGTLGGIATALEHARHEYCLVLACDLPFLSVALLRRMVELPRGYDVLVPRTEGESRQGSGLVHHTLHAIYRKRCLPAILDSLECGRRKIVGFFDKVAVQTIDETELRRYDPLLRSFFNTNTPEALEQARAWHRLAT
jgi:molybdopterin-guanine dinucleotide biosynthesis protein A